MNASLEIATSQQPLRPQQSPVFNSACDLLSTSAESGVGCRGCYVKEESIAQRESSHIEGHKNQIETQNKNRTLAV